MKSKNKCMRMIAVAALLLISILGSCSKEEPEVITPLMENGVTNYVIVRSDTASKAEIDAAIALRQAIADKTGGDIAITTDFEKESMDLVRSDYEILVGHTNRDENRKPLVNDYGYYMPTTRVCIYGGSDSALDAAVEAFINDCVSDSGIAVSSKGFEYTEDYPMKDGKIGGIAFADIEEIVCRNDLMTESAKILAGKLAELSGRLPKIVTASSTECTAILLGCPENDSRLAGLGENEFLLESDGKQLLLAVDKRYTDILKAVEIFSDELLPSSEYEDFTTLIHKVTYKPISTSVLGAPDYIGVLPDDVYTTPYRESQYTTVYAPWLKMYHLLNDYEYENGMNGGEACQQIRSFDVSTIDNNVMYFITDTTGVWKTTDGGKLWYNTNNNIPSYYGAGILCDKNDVNTVYAYLIPGGAYRSTDGGLSWTLLVKDTADYRSFNSFRFAQDGAGNTYIAAGSGIYKIAPNSDTLVNLYSKYADLKGHDAACFSDIYVSADGMDIYAAGAYHRNISASSVYRPGLYISHDGGASWEIKSLYENDGSSVTSVTVDLDDPKHIMAVAKKFDLSGKAVSGNCKLFESLDGGNSFKSVNDCGSYDIFEIRFGPKNKDGKTPLYLQYNRDFTFTAFRVSYDNGKTIVPVIKDHDSLRTDCWMLDNENHNGHWFYPFVIDYTKPDTYYHSDYGTQKYENGEFTWIGAGFSGGSVIQYNMDGDGNMIIGLTDMGTSVSGSPYTADSYATFNRTNNEILTSYAIDPNDSKHIIAFLGDNNTAVRTLGIVESFNGGVSFSKIKSGTEVSVNTSILKYSSADPNTIYASECTSKDNGRTWTKNKYFLLDVSDSYPERMIAQDKDTNDVMYSEDGGETWKKVANIAFNTNRAATSSPPQIFFDIANKDKAWYCDAWVIGYIDLAQSKCIDLKSKFAYPKFNFLAQNPKNPEHLLAVTLYTLSDSDLDPKLYETTDGGESWHIVSGVFGGFMQTIFFSKTTDEVFIGSHIGTIIYDYNAYWDYLKNKND